MFAKILSTTETSAKGISTFSLGARSNLSCFASTNLAHSWPVSSHVMLSLPKHGPFVIETMIQPTPELLRVKSSSTYVLTMQSNSACSPLDFVPWLFRPTQGNQPNLRHSGYFDILGQALKRAGYTAVAYDQVHHLIQFDVSWYKL